MMSLYSMTRRDFIKASLLAGVSAGAAGQPFHDVTRNPNPAHSEMKFGLVTYLWGQDWDLETLIRNCEIAGFEAVELRTQHAHGVEPILTSLQRRKVKERFADSPVVCVGYGSNQEYHSPDAGELKRQIEGTYELIRLCADIGASGVKVKPNDLPDGMAAEKTIAQIASSLNIIGKYAQDYGQEIRVEVHGRLTQLPTNMKEIFDQITEPNVKICWNSNAEDLTPPGLAHNFDLLKKWFGATVHVRELDDAEYPYQELFDHFADIQYNGYILLEGRTEPEDRVAAMKAQKALFDKMTKS